ncbi:phosphatidylserine decarboxylase family protein [Cytophagales bacterium LB-30]|uniref:Phosphatidylserine decarboxylase proenzyme n=1 Tax=Shiella aurantiaca TaxID=3058365 RepID=A0ABT8F2I9_9BACT|nr:phosphatidylserine decarboxylase family protein [Shiella aurantiaca]MDN4164489.1 phosphatidylserine decarboxylase family protein [Shiella aurantiaca]
MTIHREGYKILLVALFLVLAINHAVFRWLSWPDWADYTVLGVTVFFFLVILQFFRNPIFTVSKNPKQILAPVDGKVVVIENTHEGEYFKDERIQVSIFMSPVNVHVNRTPVGGVVSYFKYHAGKYLVAWHPKSSTENERTTTVVKMENGVEVLFRQIAGALAKRICWYIKEGDAIEQGAEFGFIKFGSRVDIFLPVGTKIVAELNQVTKGGRTVIAEWS